MDFDDGMYRLIRKILWLEDKQIRRWGRFSGWMCIVWGFILICGWPLLNRYCANAYDMVSAHFTARIEEIAESREINEDLKLKLNGTAAKLKELFAGWSSAMSVFLTIFPLFGVLFVVYGVTYLRLHELVLEKDRISPPLKG